MKSEYNIALIGDLNGAIETTLEVLVAREFPVAKVFPLCEGESDVNSIMFSGKPVDVSELDGFDWEQVDIAFFIGDVETTNKWANIASESCVVIDNSGAFIENKQVPLVQVDVNEENLSHYANENKISVPSAETAQIAIALKQLHQEVGIVRINVSSYQAVSNSGKQGVTTLAGETARLLNAKPLEESIFPQQTAFNVFPQVGEFDDEGNAISERRLITELRNLLQDPAILISNTQVIVPMFYGCAQSVHLQTHYPIDLDEVAQSMHHSDGIELSKSVCEYPNIITDVIGNEIVKVGRLRKDICDTTGINLWICADTIHFGVANNVIKVAERLIRDYI